MDINSNNYNYSYANTIGSSLKQPLFKLVSNIAIASNGKMWESEILLIIKVAFHFFVAVIFVIPAGLAWLLGKSIVYLSKTQIDHEGLFLAPPQIQIPQEEESDRFINIKELSDKFNQFNLSISSNQTSKEKCSTKKCLSLLCDWIASENKHLFPDNEKKRKMFCKQVTIYLRGIIKKIRSGEIPEDKQKDILIELDRASTKCHPTWLEVSARLFAEVHGQVETVEIKLQRFVQDYKETLILDFCQNKLDVQWHALNTVRNILGKELGLNTALSSLDPYAAQNPETLFDKALIKWLFLQRYEDVNRLILSIETMINSKEHDSSYYDFLLDKVKNKGIKNPQNYVATHFYSEDIIPQLNQAGVNLMLKCIGILK